MAFQKISNIKISGLSASVPRDIEKNQGSPVFLNIEESKKFIESTGIVERRIAPSAICSSDLCQYAAEELVSGLAWDKKEIDCLIFITQTPDYIVPATACILQDKLKLSTECIAFDITLGCSGWVYGLSIMASLLSGGGLKKGLLLVGETTSKTKSRSDRSTFPLFGDAGTATALEFVPGAPDMFFHLGTDGSRHKSIYIPDGAFRNPTNRESLVQKEVDSGIIRNNLQYIMDGPAVFIFSLTKPPQSIRFLLEKTGKTIDEIDYFFIHQANKIMVDKIAEKLKIRQDRVPTSYERFGNTSMSSIPLTIVTNKREEITTSKLQIISSGFGGGLSWATCLMVTDRIVCPPILEI